MDLVLYYFPSCTLWRDWLSTNPSRDATWFT